MLFLSTTTSLFSVDAILTSLANFTSKSQYPPLSRHWDRPVGFRDSVGHRSIAFTGNQASLVSGTVLFLCVRFTSVTSQSSHFNRFEGFCLFIIFLQALVDPSNEALPFLSIPPPLYLLWPSLRPPPFHPSSTGDAPLDSLGGFPSSSCTKIISWPSLLERNEFQIPESGFSLLPIQKWFVDHMSVCSWLSAGSFYFLYWLFIGKVGYFGCDFGRILSMCSASFICTMSFDWKSLN